MRRRIGSPSELLAGAATEDRDLAPVTTRVGGGRSAQAVAMALVTLFAGGWLALLATQPPPDGAPTAAPTIAPAGGAAAVPPSQSTSPALPAASAAPAQPPATPTPAAGDRRAGTPGDALIVLVELDERSYEVPLHRVVPGSFQGWANLTYPLTSGTGSIELQHVAPVPAARPRVVVVNRWPVQIGPRIDADGPVTVFELGAAAGPQVTGLPGLLGYGYLIAVTADAGHYPLVRVTLTSPFGLRLSAAGACDGGWRWTRPEDFC